ncbi:hypothetical protein [Streptomyces sp. NPDC047869]|uniref:hypothetical protein n=1 Tax=Streptomyces sp. NPDC047869 TaxID=3154709 RepID=UPI003454AD2A
MPMLAREIRHLEAAVVNLESYGGHETVLCEGYALLERCEALKEGAGAARVHEGVITLGSHTAPRRPLLDRSSPVCRRSGPGNPARTITRLAH